MTTTGRLGAAGALLAMAVPAMGQVEYGSPGFPATRMTEVGALVSDWGTVRFRASIGNGGVTASPQVESVKLDGLVPAARLRQDLGGVTQTVTAFRGPAWPGGIDVVTVRLEETAGKDATVRLAVDLPDGARAGTRLVRAGGRAALTLPFLPTSGGAMREWGHDDEASAMPGWARPEGDCDPAFRNIRAGMGGVPIHYRFAVSPRAESTVVLGFCESHWASSGQRPMVCRVEGAPPHELDPVARWGQHRPGALVLRGRDEDGNGRLDVLVMPAPTAPDQNPILNAIWLFPPGEAPDVEQVIAGRLNDRATRYVDVGGLGDQSILPPGKLETTVTVPAGGSYEVMFLMAGPGGSVPEPTRSAWSADLLRKAAVEVWRDWRP